MKADAFSPGICILLPRWRRKDKIFLWKEMPPEKTKPVSCINDWNLNERSMYYHSCIISILHVTLLYSWRHRNVFVSSKLRTVKYLVSLVTQLSSDCSPDMLLPAQQPCWRSCRLPGAITATLVCMIDSSPQGYTNYKPTRTILYTRSLFFIKNDPLWYERIFQCSYFAEYK